MKPADALKYCAAIVGIAIVLVMLVSVLVGIWSSMFLWQKAIVALIGFVNRPAVLALLARVGHPYMILVEKKTIGSLRIENLDPFRRLGGIT